MKTIKNVNYILILLFVLLYPILPTYSKFSSDLIIYGLVLINIIGFLFFKDDRKDVIDTFKSLYKDKIFISIILINLSMYGSALFAENKRLTITNGIRFSLYVFIFYCICYTVKNRQRISVILHCLLATATISALYSTYEVIRLVVIGERLTNLTNRIGSFLENSNNLGAYTILSIFIAVMLAINAKKVSHKFIYWFVTVLLLVNIISSQSRNSLIGIVIGIVIVAILYNKRLMIIAGIAPIILMILPQSRQRILQIFDLTQNQSRLDIWTIAKNMIEDHPITGIGYENFQVQYPHYTTIVDGYVALHPHNMFLKFQTELGIIGTVLLIGFLLVTTISLLRLIYKTKDKYVATVTIGILAGFISLQFMNLIDNFYSAPKVLLTMLVLLGIVNFYKLEYKNK